METNRRPLRKPTHTCKFERPMLKIEPLLLGVDVNTMIHWVEWISMRRKGQKKTKKILQCHTCGRYQVECPYCQALHQMMDLPRKYTCSNCGKEFVVEWTSV